MFDKLSEKLVEDVMDLNDQRQRERAEVDESELYDIDFKIYLDKMIFRWLGIAFLLLLCISVKAFARELYEWIFLHQIPEVDTAKFVLLILTVCFFFSWVGLFLFLMFRPSPHVVRNRLEYRGKTYHFREISLVQISSIKVLRVYDKDRRKLFTITPEYVNYDSLISWVEKCQIPVRRKQSWDPVSLQQINKMILLVSVVMFVVLIAVAMIPLLYLF